MSSIDENLQQVSRRIAAACGAARRPVQSVTLIAVSKTQPAAAIRAAHDAGQRAIGENYVQEALAKQAELTDLRDRLEWHFIGPLQRNKTAVVAEAFDWVHTIDRIEVAQRLSAQRPAWLAPLNVCLQINVSGEASKHGVLPSEALALALQVARLERLSLRGLMSIPEPTDDPTAQRADHRRLAQLLESLREHRAAEGLVHLEGSGGDLSGRVASDSVKSRGLGALDVLSMGMTADLEAAIAEGATHVRVGTAVFGPRKSK
jgi:PLP dependent protein